MEKIIEADFAAGRLPDGWWEESRSLSFEKGRLRSNRATVLKFFLPGNGWEKMRIEVDMDAAERIDYSDGTLTLSVNLKTARNNLARYDIGTLVETGNFQPGGGKREKAAFQIDRGHWSMEIDNETVLKHDIPGTAAVSGLQELRFVGNCLIRRVRVLGDFPLAFPAHGYSARKNAPFHLEAAVDFSSDLQFAPWTRDTFDQFFAELKSWGAKRCHWIHYGRMAEGWWPLADIAGKNAMETFRRCGEILPAAVEAAHRHGIQVYALLKPFDMGLFGTFPFGSAEAAQYGKLNRVGGSVHWITDFSAKNRGFIMARKPSAHGPSGAEKWTRIDVVKEDAEPCAFDIEALAILVSDDNLNYRPYDGPMVKGEVLENYPLWTHTASGGKANGSFRAVRIFRFSNLHLTSEYVAVTVDSKGASFANDLVNLIHVFGENGEDRMITYGVRPRVTAFHPAEGAIRNPVMQDFKTAGIEFDTWFRVTAIFPGYHPVRERFVFDGGHGFVGLARGKDAGPVAALSPSFPEVRGWWLAWIEDALKAGTDGIDLRVRNHHNPITWAEYGFERPVRDEFLSRYGVDIWETDDFDHGAWRRLRGEAYTGFVRDAKKLADRYHRRLGVHVSPTLNMEPDEGGSMEMHWDWRTWIDEGLADHVTMKEVWPGSRFAEEVLSHTQPRRIPVVFSPYANGSWRQGGGEEICANWIKIAREKGYDGFQFYECASVIQATSGGKLHLRRPALRALFQSIFAE